MPLGQQTGPPASAKQTAYLLALLESAGYTFATARHQFGLTQRQARGKFSVGEASALIDRLVAGDLGDPEAARAAAAEASATRAAAQLDRSRASAVRGMPADVLADELERRGWAVIPPS